MKQTSIILAAAVLCFGLVTAATALYAGTTVPDVIQMNNPAYEEHTKGIVAFTHKKHAEDYGASCGDCHHDDQGKPLADLKAGDDVQGCIACHKNPGERPKGKDAPKLDKTGRLAYHAEALHYNCRDCHKEYNKKNKTKAAPTTCTKCHPKK